MKRIYGKGRTRYRWPAPDTVAFLAFVTVVDLRRATFIASAAPAPAAAGPMPRNGSPNPNVHKLAGTHHARK